MHQRLVQGRFPKHRGVRVGEVQGVSGREIEMRLDVPLQAGDGLVFDGGRGEGDAAAGGAVFSVLAGGQSVRMGPNFDGSRIAPADRVWRNRQPSLEARLRRSWEQGVRRRVPVDAQVSGRAGEPLRIGLRDRDGNSAEAETDARLEPAHGRALEPATLREQIGRLGDTPLQLLEITNEMDAGLFVPISSLNRARRAAADALLRARRTRKPGKTAAPAAVSARISLLAEAATGSGPDPAPTSIEPQLSLLCRSPEQVEAALAIPYLCEIAVDFLEVRGLGDAVRKVRDSGRRAIAVSPRVLKPGEERIRAFLLKLGADAILVRSLGLLHSLIALPPSQRPALHGDFSLNAANGEGARLLLDAGLARLAPTHDLNAGQLCALARGADGGAGAPGGSLAPRLELIVHHHLPIFHTEHCVFARFLSDGNSSKDCGRPCERHVVHLRSQDGREHLVQADVGCRNTVFNAEAQSGLRQLDRFLRAGFRRFRVELVDHRPEELEPLLRPYRDALEGRLSGPDAWRRLRESSRFPLTLGSLRVVDTPQQLKQPGWMG
jgi:collagenase-like PrtC family protease